MNCIQSGPLVTVAIPTLYRHTYLQESIASALSQTYRNLEVLVADDGMNQDVRAVSEAAAHGDSRVRYWRNSERRGLAGNWNRCLELARGEYIIIIGDDDRLLPEGIAVLMEDATEDVIFGHHFLIDEVGRRLENETERNTRRYERDRIPPGPIACPEEIVWKNSVSSSASLVRSRAARGLRFKEDVNTPEIILFAELARDGASFRFVGKYVSEYRVHGGAATVTGLWHDKLVPYLSDIQVSIDTDTAKRKLLQSLLPAAVGRCLLRGDIEEAARLASNPNYPRGWNKPLSVLVQQLCLVLPGSRARNAYAALHRWRHRLSWFILRRAAKTHSSRRTTNES
jgi:glycosyltransferase involved in cell wall biosynthesis